MRNEKEMYSKIFRRIREDRRLTQYQMAELAECSLRNYQNNMVKNLKLAPCELFLNKEALEYDSTICEIAVLARTCSKEQRNVMLKIIKDVMEVWPK